MVFCWKCKKRVKYKIDAENFQNLFKKDSIQVICDICGGKIHLTGVALECLRQEQINSMEIFKKGSFNFRKE